MNQGVPEPRHTVETRVVSPAELGIGILFDRMREAAIVADVRDERIVLWNGAAVDMFGYSPSEAVGLPLEVLVPESLREAHHSGLATYRRTGGGAVIEATSAVEVPALRRDGTEFMVELSLSPLDGDTAPGLVLAVLRDVSERQRLAERLAGANAGLHLALQTEQAVTSRLGDLVQLKDELIGMLSHDLGSPLAAVKGYAALLERSWERLAVEQRNEALQAIGRSAERMGQLIRQLLDAAQLDAGAVPYECGALDVRAELQAAIDEQRIVHEDRFELVVAQDLPPAFADPGRHMQIVTNLLSNAAKFSPGDSAVSITAELDGDHVRVRVRDRGAGVPDDDADAVFGRFTRLEGAGETHGHGLGLYITRRLVEDQHGSIGVSNHPEGGAEFVYTLPTAPWDHPAPRRDGPTPTT